MPETISSAESAKARPVGQRLRAATRDLEAAVDRRLKYVFVAPSSLFLVLLVVYPVGANLWLSLTDKRLVSPSADFVGLRNYEAIAASAEFWLSMLTGAVWTTSSVGLQLVLGLITALLLYQNLPGSAAFRVLLIVPWTFPTVVSVITWQWLLNDMYGIVNHALLGLGLIPKPIAFLGLKTTALPTMVGIEVWRGFPFMMLALLAGLQAIPEEQFDSAEVEGASVWQQIRYVVLPNLRPIIGIVLVLRTIWVFNSFDLIFLATGGGPAKATQTAPIFVYLTGWVRLLTGQASAICVVMSLCLFAAAFVYFRLLRLEEGVDS